MSAVPSLLEAAQAVRTCTGQPPAEAKQTFHRAMCDVIDVRNRMLASDNVPDPDRRDQMNSLLSLMSSIEFPLGGFHSERMQSVVRTLEALAQSTRVLSR